MQEILLSFNFSCDIQSDCLANFVLEIYILLFSSQTFAPGYNFLNFSSCHSRYLYFLVDMLIGTDVFELVLRKLWTLEPFGSSSFFASIKILINSHSTLQIYQNVTFKMQFSFSKQFQFFDGTKDIAIRLLPLEHKFIHNSELRKEYNALIQAYWNKGHIPYYFS